MDLESNNEKFSEDSSTHTSHVTEYSAGYLSINTSGLNRRSMRAMLLCNSQSCSCATSDGKNCTCSCKRQQRTQAKRVVLSDRINDYEYTPVQKDFREKIVERSQVTSDHLFSYSTQCLQSKSLGTQYGVSRNEPKKKVSVFTENNIALDSLRQTNITNNHHTNNSNVHGINVNSFNNNENYSRANERIYAEKTTYCRPGRVNQCDHDYFNRTRERNNKLQYLVRKIIEAREREKQTEAWNNYINELKNKHGFYNELTTTPEWCVAGSCVTPELIDGYYNIRFTGNPSDTCTHVLDDFCGAHSTSYPINHRCMPTTPNNEYIPIKTPLHSYRREIYDNEPFCYPISSEAQLMKLKKDRTRSSYDHGRGNLVVVEKDPEQRPRKRKRSRNTEMRDAAAQTSTILLDEQADSFKNASTEFKKVDGNSRKETTMVNTQVEKNKRESNDSQRSKVPSISKNESGGKTESKSNVERQKEQSQRAVQGEKFKNDIEKGEKVPSEATKSEQPENLGNFDQKEKITDAKRKLSNTVNGEKVNSKSNLNPEEKRQSKSDLGQLNNSRAKQKDIPSLTAPIIEESTLEKYQRVSESVAKLREHLERSRSNNVGQQCLSSIETKLDSLINTMNALLAEIHAKMGSVPETCDKETCISKNTNTFDASAEKRRQSKTTTYPENVNIDKCIAINPKISDMNTCIAKNVETKGVQSKNVDNKKEQAKSDAKKKKNFKSTETITEETETSPVANTEKICCRDIGTDFKTVLTKAIKDFKCNLPVCPNTSPSLRDVEAKEMPKFKIESGSEIAIRSSINRNAQEQVSKLIQIPSSPINVDSNIITAKEVSVNNKEITAEEDVEINKTQQLPKNNEDPVREESIKAKTDTINTEANSERKNSERTSTSKSTETSGNIDDNKKGKSKSKDKSNTNEKHGRESSPSTPKEKNKKNKDHRDDKESNNNETVKRVDSSQTKKMDTFLCVIPDKIYPLCKQDRHTFVDRGVCIDKILNEELDKSNKAKRDIDSILNGDRHHPCGVQITIDIPTRERATEVTASLSRARIEEIRTPLRGDRQMTIAAVNTDPLTLLGLLRISTDTIRRLLSGMNFDYYSYLPMLPQLPVQLANTRNAVNQYVCNICGAVFGRPTQLSDHLQAHNLGAVRDCCVCRHLLELRQRCPGIFTCQYCGQCFTRAYCCELHQESCARRLGRRHDVSESLVLLR